MPEFECRREVILPATPEEVFDAVATRAGNAAWLFPNEIEPDASTTTAWDPPHRFATRQAQGDWFNALEFEIEGRAGGRTLLRYVHSGIFVDDWDSQYDAVSQHTDFYLHTLGQYLEHFRGRTAAYVGDVPGGIQGPPSSATPDGFTRLKHALGIPADATTGDHVHITPAGAAPIDGVIDYSTPNFLGVRTADALYRFFGRNAFGGPVGMSIHSFAPVTDAERAAADWRAVLAAA